MRPVNLIPPEDRRGERAPLRTGPLPYVIVGALVIAFAGVYMMVSAGNSVTENETVVASLEQDLEASAARAEALQSFTDFASLEQARTETISQLATSRFDWERVLRELALVLPEGITLGEVTGSIGADGEVGGIAGPQIAITGCALGQETVATMVAALRDIDGVTRVGLSNSTTPGLGGDSGTATSSDSDEEDSSALGCGLKKLTTFDLTIVFDEVAVDPASGGIATPEAPAPEDEATGGPQAAQQAQQDAVESAEDQSRKAVDQFVPGASG